MLSLLLLAIPTIFSLGKEPIQRKAPTDWTTSAVYSLVVAVMILLYYVLSFVFQLGDPSIVLQPLKASAVFSERCRDKRRKTRASQRF